jgi:hypothetical protein
VAVDPAVGGARDLNSFPFASLDHCSREKEKLEMEFTSKILALAWVEEEDTSHAGGM